MKNLLFVIVWLLFAVATPASGDDLGSMDDLFGKRVGDAELEMMAGHGVKVILPGWIGGEDWRIKFWDEADMDRPQFNFTSGSGNTQMNKLIK